MRTAKVMSISLTPDMSDEVQAIAKEERRSVSEVFREALRQYATGRDVARVRRQAQSHMKQKGIKPSDIPGIVAEGRKHK